MRRGYLARNPMTGVRLEPEEDKVIRVATDVEQNAVETAAERLCGFRWRALVLTRPWEPADAVASCFGCALSGGR